jgi:hypothetical protein
VISFVARSRTRVPGVIRNPGSTQP